MMFQVVYIVSTDFPKCKCYFSFIIFRQTQKGEEGTGEIWLKETTELDEPFTFNEVQ